MPSKREAWVQSQFWGNRLVLAARPGCPCVLQALAVACSRARPVTCSLHHHEWLQVSPTRCPAAALGAPPATGPVPTWPAQESHSRASTPLQSWEMPVHPRELATVSTALQGAGLSLPTDLEGMLGSNVAVEEHSMPHAHWLASNTQDAGEEGRGPERQGRPATEEEGRVLASMLLHANATFQEQRVTLTGLPRPTWSDPSLQQQQHVPHGQGRAQSHGRPTGGRSPLTFIHVNSSQLPRGELAVLNENWSKEASTFSLKNLN